LSSSFPFDLPPDPSQPVLSALRRACTENWSAFTALTARAGKLVAEKSLNEIEAVKMMELALMHATNVSEILRWVSCRKPFPVEQALQRAEPFRELGDEWVETFASSLQKLPQGRPSKKRQSHIDAFEYMLRSRNNTMGQAVRRFCTCGEQQHDAECYRNIKAGIHVVSKMLHKHAPEIVAQYDALHPDRAKKLDRK